MKRGRPPKKRGRPRKTPPAEDLDRCSNPRCPFQIRIDRAMMLLDEQIKQSQEENMLLERKSEMIQENAQLERQLESQLQAQLQALSPTISLFKIPKVPPPMSKSSKVPKASPPPESTEKPQPGPSELNLKATSSQEKK